MTIQRKKQFIRLLVVISCCQNKIERKINNSRKLKQWHKIRKSLTAQKDDALEDKDVNWENGLSQVLVCAL